MKDGLFSFLDFTKPGRDQPEPKQSFVRFWYRYAMRFFHLIRLNLIFFAVSLPFYVWAMTMYNAYITQEGLKSIALFAALIQYALQWMPAAIRAALVVLSVFLIGPANAGLQFVAGRYAAGEHAWPWLDFFAAAKENWKQGLLFGVVDALVIVVSFYYLAGSETLFSAYVGVARAAWIILLVFYGFGRCYLYPIMVQIDLKVGQLLKNAVLLALVKPWRALVILLTAATIALLCAVADMVMLPLFAYSFLAYTTGALSAPVIRKYLIDPTSEAETELETPRS